MSIFMNPKFSGLKEYTPGEQPKNMEYIKLNTNESPYPPSKEVIEAVNSDVVASLKLYPDPDCIELRNVIGDFYNVEAENVFITNGSDDILNFAFMAFGQNGAVFPDITYGFYKVFSYLNGVSYEEIALNKDLLLVLSHKHQNKYQFSYDSKYHIAIVCVSVQFCLNHQKHIF